MTSWAPYNENQPFGKGSTVISSDNITASKARHAANRACIKGTATPEQMLLAAQCDVDMARIIAERK